MKRCLTFLLFLAVFASRVAGQEYRIEDASRLLNEADSVSQLKFEYNYVLWATHAGQAYRLTAEADTVARYFKKSVSAKFKSKIRNRLSTEGFWRSRTYWLREWTGSRGRFDLKDKWKEYPDSKFPSLSQEELIAFSRRHEITPANDRERSCSDTLDALFLEYVNSKSYHSGAQKERLLQSALDWQKTIARRTGKRHIFYAVATCQVAMVNALLGKYEDSAHLYDEAARVFRKRKDELGMRLAIYSASHQNHELAKRLLSKEDSIAVRNCMDREYERVVQALGPNHVLSQIVTDERQAMSARLLTDFERHRAEEDWRLEKQMRDPNADTFAEGVSLSRAGKYAEAAKVFMLCDSLDKKKMPWGDFRRQYTQQWVVWCLVQSGQADSVLDYLAVSGVVPSIYELVDCYFYTTVIGAPPIDRSKTYKIDHWVNRIEKKWIRGNYKKQYLQKVGDVFGTGSPEYARVLTHVCLSLSIPAGEVLDSLNRAQALFTSHLGKDELMEAYFLEKRAVFYDWLGYAPDAIDCQKAALDIYARRFGKDSRLYNRLIDRLLDFYKNTDQEQDMALWQLQKSESDPSLDLYHRLDLLSEAASTFYQQNAPVDGMNPVRKASDTYTTLLTLCRRQKVEQRFKELIEKPSLLDSLLDLGMYDSSIRDSLGYRELCYYKYLRAQAQKFHCDFILQYRSGQRITAIDSLNTLITDIDGVLEHIPKDGNHSDLYRNYSRSLQGARIVALFKLLGAEYHARHYERAVDIADQEVKIESSSNRYRDRFTPIDTLSTLNYKSRSLIALGRFAEADSLWQRTIAHIAENEQNTHNREERNDRAYYNYALALQDMGKAGQAAEKMEHYLERITPRILGGLVAENALNRERYWRNEGDFFERDLPSFVLKNRQPPMIGQLYDAALLCKGLLLNTEKEIMRLLSESGDTTLISLYGRWREDQPVLERQLRLTPSNRTLNADSLQLLQRTRQRNIFEATSKDNQATIIQSLRTSWTEVREALGAADAAVEFLTVPAGRNNVHYIALTVRPGYDAPHMTVLCRQDEILHLSDNEIYQTDTLYSLLWKPLEAELTKAKRIFFSPAGILHQIGIEHLPGLQQGSYYRLSSTREIIHPHTNADGMDAALFGGLQYELDDAERRQFSLEHPAEEIPHQRDISAIRELRGAGQALPVLEGSLREVQSIGEILHSQSSRAFSLTGLDGTETSFKSLSGQGKSLIHLSTHGFYLPSSDGEDADEWMQELTGARQNLSFEEQSLRRSGLLMSGAADFVYGISDGTAAEDGILTAEEISQMNLQGLDLVVLSACETGLGDISGDGVFGLQRGFKKAGAQSILMSLWKVDDDATCLLMTEFYDNWVRKRMTKHDALKEATKAVRSHKERGWDDPSYWAAFILLDGLD